MILLRHAQSQFNAHYSRFREDPGIRDPSLTGDGHAQAERAAALLCGAGAAPIAARLGLVPEIVPLARERFAFSCDVGSPPARLALDWPELDFSGLPDRWWHVDGHGDAVGSVVESEDGVIERAARFRGWIEADASHTLLVSHWGFLLALSGRSLENGEAIAFDPTAPAPSALVWR